MALSRSSGYCYWALLAGGLVKAVIELCRRGLAPRCAAIARLAQIPPSGESGWIFLFCCSDAVRSGLKPVVGAILPFADATYESF